MKHKTIHNDLDMMKAIAIHHAKLHNCNYNIVLLNPDPDGNFDEQQGSTYEFVRDSFLENYYRNNIKLLHKTDDLISMDKNIKTEEKTDNTNDKRYTEPFEDDGAYAD